MIVLRAAQWGYSDNVYYAPVTFPISFTAQVYSAVGTKNRSGSDKFPLNITDVTLTGCVMAQASDIAPCYWIAIGK